MTGVAGDPDGISAAVVDIDVALGTWRVKTPRGIVSQPSFDEDVVTLSARSGLGVLERHPDIRPTSLIVATLSSPLAEPGAAPFLSEIFDMASQLQGVDTFELGGSVTAGLAALELAMLRIAAGQGPVLVIAADDRRDSRGRPLGAASVAILLDQDGAVGRLSPIASASGLFLDRWQRRDSEGVQVGDRSLDAFAPGRAFVRSLDLGRSVTTHAAGPTIERIGFPGVAGTLVAWLSTEIAVGEGVALTSTGGGITRALSFVSGPGWPAAFENAAHEFGAGREESPPPIPDESGFDPFHSHAAAFRERAQTYRLEGAKDPASGRVFFPPPPGTAGTRLEPFRLGRSGTVATVARDHIFPLGSPLTMAIVDLEGGGRFYGQVADGLDVGIGEEVELVLRRLHDGGGVPNYFWKVRPIEGTGV